MSCETIQDTLVFFHFGELPPGERSATEDHLGGCRHCLRAYWTLKHASDASLDPSGPVPSPDLRERVSASLTTGRTPAARSMRVRLGVAAVAAALVVVLGLATLWPEPGGRIAPPRTARLDLEHIDSSRLSPATLDYL